MKTPEDQPQNATLKYNYLFCCCKNENENSLKVLPSIYKTQICLDITGLLFTVFCTMSEIILSLNILTSSYWAVRVTCYFVAFLLFGTSMYFNCKSKAILQGRVKTGTTWTLWFTCRINLISNIAILLIFIFWLGFFCWLPLAIFQIINSKVGGQVLMGAIPFISVCLLFISMAGGQLKLNYQGLKSLEK